MAFANAEQASFWSELAPTWVEVEDLLEVVSGLPGELAMERLDVVPGQRVLDLGCGTGRTTLAIASRVAPDGQAVGVDIAAEMLEPARRRAAEQQVANVEFLHADAQSADLGKGAFDAVYSRFGVMFYSDPLAAFSNVHRSMRPGGVLSFACWQAPSANEWMLVPGMAAVSVLGVLPPMPGPDEPGPFSFADVDRVAGILGSAGFRDIDVAPHNDVVSTTEDRIPMMAGVSTRIGAIREMLKDADAQTIGRVRAAVEEALRSRVKDGAAGLSRGFLLVKARA